MRNKPYRNNKNREIEDKGTPRKDLTELYHLENIDNWLKYIFWAIIFGDILVTGVAIRILVSYF